jgi:hypothetical protein
MLWHGVLNNTNVRSVFKQTLSAFMFRTLSHDLLSVCYSTGVQWVAISPCHNFLDSKFYLTFLMLM